MGAYFVMDDRERDGQPLRMHRMCVKEKEKKTRRIKQKTCREIEKNKLYTKLIIEP